MVDLNRSATATIDDDLNQIERDVRTLKIEYEQYFGGGRQRPPTDTQWRVDSLIRRTNERLGELNSGQRFRFNNLAYTYAKYQDMWRKKVMQKESGVVAHHYGAAAKAVEAERARVAAARERGGGMLDELAAVKALAARNSGAKAFALSLSDPDEEMPKVETLYAKLIEARAQTGEQAGAPSLKDFQIFVRKKTRELKEKGGVEIEYSVGIENGRVRLKARIAG